MNGPLPPGTAAARQAASSQHVEEIAGLAARMDSRLGVRREIRLLPELLLPSETPGFLCDARLADDHGLIAPTDQRLIFLAAGIIFDGYEEILLTSLTSAQVRTADAGHRALRASRGGGRAWSGPAGG